MCLAILTLNVPRALFVCVVQPWLLLVVVQCSHTKRSPKSWTWDWKGNDGEKKCFTFHLYSRRLYLFYCIFLIYQCQFDITHISWSRDILLMLSFDIEGEQEHLEILFELLAAFLEPEILQLGMIGSLIHDKFHLKNNSPLTKAIFPRRV